MSRTKTISLTLGSLAAGAVIATGITGVALADDSSPAPSSSASSAASAIPSMDNDAPDRGAREGQRHGDRGSQPLHGEMVVQAADGTIATVQMVRGTVTSVSASSITVKAEDGFSATFAVSATTDVHVGLPARGTDPGGATTDSITDVAVGDVAGVHGTVSGGVATATEVRAMTAEEAASPRPARQGPPPMTRR